MIAAIVAVSSNTKSNRNAADIQEYKSATDRDLERLKAKLGHGQLISSTQWNAEFSAYQKLWKSMVPLRVLARKVVLRESELAELGLEAGNVSKEDTVQNRKKLLFRFITALNECLEVTNENAPFYDAKIREVANDAHVLASDIRKSEMSVLVAQQNNHSSTKEEAARRDLENRRTLDKLKEKSNQMEGMIRKILADVQVIS